MPESNRRSQITEPPRPATNRPARIRTRTSEVGARRAPGYTTGLESGRPGSNGPLRGGAPMLFPLSYVRDTPGWSRTSDLCRIRAVLSTELRASSLEKPPAGIEPAPRPYKGRVLPLTLRRQEVETAGVEPAPSRCKRVAPPPELRPQGADGWSRTTTARGTAFTARRAHRIAQRPLEERATDRIRTGTARITTSDAAVTPQPP